jgi:hypothetical protein
MDIGPLHLSVELALWSGFLLCGGLLVVFRGWWVTLPALLGEYLLLGVLLSLPSFDFVPKDIHIGPITTSSLVLVKTATGIIVVGILALTVAARRRIRLPESERPIDEVTAARLRWAARRTARMGEGERYRPATYLVPTAALAILIATTYALATLYPVARGPTLPRDSAWFYVDFVWYWLGLSGIFVMLFAREMQEVSLGLLLCIGSVDLLYTVLSRSVGLLAMGLLSAVSILLALGSAYLAQLFYLRLRRWQLPSAEEWD